MNAIVNNIIEQRNGHYVHALEVNDIYELESAVESLCEEFSKEYTKDEIIEFFESIQIFCLIEENEEEVWSLDIEGFLNELI